MASYLKNWPIIQSRFQNGTAFVRIKNIFIFLAKLANLKTYFDSDFFI